MIALLLACAPPDDDAVIDAAWTGLDETYALFDVKGIDWDAARDPLPDAPLYERLTAMLEPLDDNHVQLLAPGHDPWSAGSLQGAVRDSFHADVVTSLLDSAERPHPRVITGTVGDVAYLWLGVLDGPTTRIGADWLATRDEPVLLLDLRDDLGGYDHHARRIASRVVEEPHLYMQMRRRAGPAHDDWTDWLDYTIEPDADRFPGRVGVLTNEWTVSGGETLLLSLDDDVVRIGQTTAGAFGARLWHDLPNGWALGWTLDDVRDEAGSSFEGIGLAPDIPALTTLADLEAGRDPILEAGLTWAMR